MPPGRRAGRSDHMDVGPHENDELFDAATFRLSPSVPGIGSFRAVILPWRAQRSLNRRTLNN
jgi:hypothetical protein